MQDLNTNNKIFNKETNMGHFTNGELLNKDLGWHIPPMLFLIPDACDYSGKSKVVEFVEFEEWVDKYLLPHPTNIKSYNLFKHKYSFAAMKQEEDDLHIQTLSYIANTRGNLVLSLTHIEDWIDALPSISSYPIIWLGGYVAFHFLSIPKDKSFYTRTEHATFVFTMVEDGLLTPPPTTSLDGIKEITDSNCETKDNRSIIDIHIKKPKDTVDLLLALVGDKKRSYENQIFEVLNYDNVLSNLRGE